MSINTTKKDFGESVISKVEEALKSHIEAHYEEMRHRLIKSLDERKNEILAGLCLDFMKFIEVQTLDNRVVITIRQEALKIVVAIR